MRKRKEIQEAFDNYPYKTKERIQLEVLLDIRELLISQNVTPIPFLSTQQAVDELRDEIREAIKK